MKAVYIVLDTLTFAAIVANIAISLDADNIHAFGAWIVSLIMWAAKVELSIRLSPSPTKQEEEVQDERVG